MKEARKGGTQGATTRLSDRFLVGESSWTLCMLHPCLTSTLHAGEELGRGAFGQVFKGIDSASGNTVAIKQISLNDRSQDNLQGVMGEIDLLKTLNHRNIVKYLGSFKTRTHLYIILEFMENGSLSGIIKSCGVLNEELVAVYVTQVLQGLRYLHQQGVVHRDIKGAITTQPLTNQTLFLLTAPAPWKASRLNSMTPMRPPFMKLVIDLCPPPPPFAS